MAAAFMEIAKKVAQQVAISNALGKQQPVPVS